ncbi:BTAD domain-containing putative transcriptional regulator [Dactylosporangium sp. NPDC049742]|uniref:BTAD domain-containing putative transcriptional regulator n=1 Tax=Dactylosporangium sp. NPDC049742 TaxID=3154737 RepID=UPI0034250E8A
MTVDGGRGGRVPDDGRTANGEADDVSVSVLGPMRVRVGGRETGVGGPRPRTVLALLVAAGGRAVPADTLIEQVWPRRPPGRADNTLQGYIASLRRIVEPGRAARAVPRRLVLDGAGYALRLSTASVDADRFERAAAEAHAALVAHRPGTAAALLDMALPLWRGRPYEDVPDAPLLLAHAALLERTRATVEVDRQAAAIALGEHAGAVARLQALVEESPLDERLWELLALAQYRAGRQGDALATLRAARRRLAADLGVDPGDRLRRLERQVLAQAPVLDGPEAGTPAESAPPPGRLPAAVDELVGRGPATADVAVLLGTHRLVTLVGPAGVGKTRLALEVGRPAAARLADLTPVRDGALVAATVARALGLVGVEDAGRLTQVLHGRETLLVLDNCEHLADGAAEVVTALLQFCPGVRVLATARQPLRVAGETIVEVAPLALGDAVELFVRRARSARPGWSPDRGDEQLIRRICAAVDGLPLAVEIAAARSRVLPLDRLADGLLDHGRRGGPARHRSLSAALRWGYSLLEPAEQRLLRVVSVFAGSFTLDAVDGLLGRLDPDRAGGPAERIGELVERSLVVREPGDRYRLLQTVRQFARRLAAPAERDAARRAHLHWMCETAEEADRAMVAGGAGHWGARLAQERDDIRQAFATARSLRDAGSALRIAAALLWFWYRWGSIAEGTALLREFLGDAAPPVVVARARFALGALRYLAGDIAEAHALTTLARETAAEAGDPVTEARCLGYAAHFAVLVGADPRQAVEDAERGVRLAATTGLDWLWAEASSSLGLVLSLVAGPEVAVPHLHAAWRTALRCGHEWVACSASWAAIRIECEQGRPRVAAGLGAEVLTHLVRSGDRTTWLMIAHTTAGALAGLAGLAGRDAADDAAVLLGAVDAMAAEIGVDVGRIDPLHAPAVRAAVEAALPDGRFEAAARRGRALRRSDVVTLLQRYRTAA